MSQDTQKISAAGRSSLLEDAAETDSRDSNSGTPTEWEELGDDEDNESDNLDLAGRDAEPDDFEADTMPEANEARGPVLRSVDDLADHELGEADAERDDALAVQARLDGAFLAPDAEDDITELSPELSPDMALSADRDEELDWDDAEQLVADDTEYPEMIGDEEEAPQTSASLFGKIAAALAWLLVLGWSGAFFTARLPYIEAGASMRTWTVWIAEWSIPVALVGVIWLAVMRSSRKEARRYGAMANALHAESDRLEERLSGMNRELSLARDFLAAQSRELESLGRQASERLSTHAAELHDLVEINTSRVETLSTVSTTALENMERLKQNLPVVSNSARDVTSQIGNAGVVAAEQVGELQEAFQQLSATGADGERQIDNLRGQISEAVASISVQSEDLDLATTSRMDALRERAATMHDELSRHQDQATEALQLQAQNWDALLRDARQGQQEAEEAALAALQTRISTVRDGAASMAQDLHRSEADALESWEARVDTLNNAIAKIGEDIARLDALSEENARSRLAAFSDQAAALDAALQERQETQRMQAEAFAQQGEDVLKRFKTLREDMKAIATQGHEVESGLAMGLELLGTKLRESRLALDTTGDTIASLNRSANTLLGAIQSSTHAGREELAEALADAHEQLSAIKAEAVEVDALIASTREKGREVSDFVHGAQGASKQTEDHLTAVQARYGETQSAHEQALGALADKITALNAESEALVARTEGELASALEELREVTRKAVDELESGAHTRVHVLGSTIGARAAEEIERAVEAQANSSLTDLENAAQTAAGLGKEVVVQLRDQLARVNELTSNLEARVSRARENAEEQVDNDFSRRIALLNESLNSHGIDIAKALSVDVTDSQWTSYLKGDRSIFVRRAVRLLDNTEAREIAEIFDTDPDFREHVSRYIHDFEAMLRTMLSTRDGHALGVTLLSSDVGKLYVVLAQAIERLRD